MRKLLNSLYIPEETAYLTLDGENIVCRAEDSEKFRVPFTNIEDIYIFSYSGCSPALMGKCAEYGIAVNFISPQLYQEYCRRKAFKYTLSYQTFAPR